MQAICNTRHVMMRMYLLVVVLASVQQTIQDVAWKVAHHDTDAGLNSSQLLRHICCSFTIAQSEASRWAMSHRWVLTSTRTSDTLAMSRERSSVE